MNIYTEDENKLTDDLPFDCDEILKKCVLCVLRSEGFPENTELSVTYVDCDEIKKINKETRGIDSVTDVLSFPMISYRNGCGYDSADEETIDFNPENDDILLGDIVLCIPKVISQAKEYGHSIKREFAFLIVHSMLHLMGHDHMNEDEMSRMEDRQRDIMSMLQITRKERL